MNRRMIFLLLGLGFNGEKFLKENITYQINSILNLDEIIHVYNDSGLRRPTNDKERIKKMFENSNLVISAWDKNIVVGISRAITDFSYCCYLSDLAVIKAYQKMGIGKELIRITKEQIGENAMLLLLSAPEAMEYYPKIGMENVKNGFLFKREG